MKHLMQGFLACAVSLALLWGCAATTAGGTPPTAAQQAITATANSYSALDVGILSATDAVRNGTLKGDDAANAYRAMVAAQKALNLALTSLRNAQAAAVASAAWAASAPPSTASGAKP